ncbi:MAG: hypothetical protein C5B59_10220 [Bacteroidetes bacterium]|nr:MAG: hypothetical protein C5B59_10220 [Bacteroidota bacterium]
MRNRIIKTGFKIAIAVLLLIALVYTTYGILELSKSGGPCNAGLAFIVLMPGLLICTILLSSSFILYLRKERSSQDRSLLLAIISLVVWGFWIMAFMTGDVSKEGIYFLGPFLLFHILGIGVLWSIRPQKRMKKS